MPPTRITAVSLRDRYDDEDAWLARVDDANERARILRYRQPRDRQRALVGALLVRRRLAEVYGEVPVHIERTLAGKPFAKRPEGTMCPHEWAFNLSHHGDWVVLADHPTALAVGVDVVDTTDLPANTTQQQLLDSLRAQLTDREWAELDVLTGADQLRHLFRLWALKESYVKGLGVGLGMALNEVSFSAAAGSPTPGFERMRVLYRGAEQPQWCVDIGNLDSRYCVAVAIHDPYNDALPSPIHLLCCTQDAYLGTL